MFNDSWGSLEELSQSEDNIYFAFTLLYKLVLFYFYSDYHWDLATINDPVFGSDYSYEYIFGCYGDWTLNVGNYRHDLGSRLSKN